MNLLRFLPLVSTRPGEGGPRGGEGARYRESPGNCDVIEAATVAQRRAGFAGGPAMNHRLPKARIFVMATRLARPPARSWVRWFSV